MSEHILGRVTTITGSQVWVSLDDSSLGDRSARIGATIKIPTPDSAAIGTISAVQVDPGPPPRTTVTVDLFGELIPSDHGCAFSRGVSSYPFLEAIAVIAGTEDLAAVYNPPTTKIRIGKLHYDESQRAYLLLDELLSKHFAVLGSTGSGKSTAVTLILAAMLMGLPNAHVVLLDAHNEYAAALGEFADILNVDNLNMPFWLCDFEEAQRVLIRGGSIQEQEAQAIILKDAITKARRYYAGENGNAASITVDTPAPYQLSYLLRCIDDGRSKLDKPDTSIPYLRLKTRLESLRDDRRFAFMFSEGLTTRDSLGEFVGQFLRIPAEGKPLTILDLSGLPIEIADVVVALSCRVVFDFVLWSDHKRMAPVLLVCEEAHRFVPADEREGFSAASRALTRIAKEGRKYGISLGLISQRPSQLSPDALSQCGTIIAMRMGSEVDQRFVARALPDAAQGMLASLPMLRTREAIVSGEGVLLPMRIRFDEVPEEHLPRGDGVRFSQAWGIGSRGTREPGRDFVEDGIRRWRLQTRS